MIFQLVSEDRLGSLKPRESEGRVNGMCEGIGLYNHGLKGNCLGENISRGGRMGRDGAGKGDWHQIV